MYLFDAQNRWGYEFSALSEYLRSTLYLFDAQNRWGYEIIMPNDITLEYMCIYSMLRIVGVMRALKNEDKDRYDVYLFDAQNRWGYEATFSKGLFFKLFKRRFF